MYSPKRKLSSDEQLDSDNPGNTSLNITSTSSDVDSPARSYALIETSSNELDHIIDLLRQFFPKTKVLECNHTSQTTVSQQATSIGSNYTSQFLISSVESDNNNDQTPSNTSSPIFKGKVKDYLQRRYLEQIGEHQSHKEILTKSRSNDINSFDFSSTSSTINKPAITCKSRSLDLSSIVSEDPLSDDRIKTKHPPLVRSQSKRDFLQYYISIDIDDTSDDAGKITFSINQPDDDDGDDDGEEEDEEEEEEEKSRSFRYSFSEQQTDNKNNNFLLPYHHHQHSCEQEQGKITSPFLGGISLPLTPYSVSSDPGPFRSPWFNTPTSPFNFRFPQTQEQVHVNAQGSIAQLSNLTKMLCDEPSLFTPISPRLKTEKHNMNTSKDSLSVSPCQICRQEFDSHQMYLTHYRDHLENDQSVILNSHIKCDRFSDLRNYSCKICSKRFSRSDMLNRHLRLHSGIRPYRCTMCNTYFSRSDHLSTHLRTHTGEKPYTCPQCSYTACRRDMITRHLKIHTKQRSERKNATSTFASSNDF